jgi:hypothetical protein
MALLILAFAGLYEIEYTIGPCLTWGIHNDGYDPAISAKGMMIRIGEAEQRYFSTHKKYGNLVEINPAHLPVSDPLKTGMAGYSIELKISPTSYRLTAQPTLANEKCCCILGIARYPWFSSDESRVVQENRHCQSANR